MPKGSLFLSSSRSRISSNCFSSSNNRKHLIQKPQIGCTPRLPHRNQETNKPETSWQSLHPSPPQKKRSNQTLQNWSLNPTNLLPTVASVCFLLRFSNSKRIFSMPVSSFIPIHAAMFIMFEHPLFFKKNYEKNPPPTWRNKGSNPSWICRPRSNFLVQAIVRLPVAFGAVGPIDPWVSVSRWVKNVIFLLHNLHSLKLTWRFASARKLPQKETNVPLPTIHSLGAMLVSEGICPVFLKVQSY